MQIMKELKLDLADIIRNRIPYNTKICFATGMIIGWITHFYMLTHKLPNWDDISQINRLGLTKQIGRWMLDYLQFIGQKASNPAIHGMLAIIFVSLSACLVVATLKLKSVTASILIPTVMITFPSLTGIMYFMFTAHLYAVGIFLFCLSAYIIQRYKYGFAISGICIILGLALYQPFISISISLMLLILTFDALDGAGIRNLLKEGIKYALSLALSTFLYIKISHIIYPEMDKETYGGVNEMGKIVISELPINFARVYKRVLEYFVTRPFGYISSFAHVMNICLCALLVVFLLLFLLDKRRWNRVENVCFAGLMVFLLPFAMGFVYFMAPNAPFSTLMIYAYSMFYIFLIALSEKLQSSVTFFAQENRHRRLLCGIPIVITFASVLLVCYSAYILDSQAYFRTSIAVERANSFYNRVVSRVEDMPGYKRGDRVAILGEHYYVDNPAAIEIPLFDDDEGLRELSGVALENGLITSGVRSDYLRTYIGFEPGWVSEDEKKEILDSPEYASMTLYPQTGSISKINDIWIVKLCD